jgi:hypothetical protein
MLVKLNDIFLHGKTGEIDYPGSITNNMVEKANALTVIAFQRLVSPQNCAQFYQ